MLPEMNVSDHQILTWGKTIGGVVQVHQFSIQNHALSVLNRITGVGVPVLA